VQKEVQSSSFSLFLERVLDEKEYDLITPDS
jgi:hypothetical protein